MNKYIDAEKLKAEIEKKRETLISEYNELAKYEVWRSANDNKIKIYTISDILSLINSLQQEQPEVDLEKAAKHVYESWMVGTMDDVRRDMVELGKVLNARKEEGKLKEEKL